ncbi:MAG TPA: hypothetical protein VGB94_13330 [Acidobacteriaceae bacterium]
MVSAFISIVEVVLAATFAIMGIFGIFTLASYVFHSIAEQFERGALRGIGAVALTLLALAVVVFAAEIVEPYVVNMYRYTVG